MHILSMLILGAMVTLEHWSGHTLLNSRSGLCIPLSDRVHIKESVFVLNNIGGKYILMIHVVTMSPLRHLL